MTTRRTARRDTLAALVAIAAVGTFARLLLLGDRIAHWSEGRLGYDVLHYAATGVFEYRPLIHAPLLYHVDRFLFETIGPSDLALRLPVAVVGGLLPLAAWLYRDHLDDVELVALGAVLAANPVLVYYSRFARGDVLVAAFAFTTLGLLARTRATGRHRYLYVAGVVAALALASHASALLHLFAWVVAGLVALDQRGLAAAFRGDADRTTARLRALVDVLRDRGSPETLVVAVLNPVVVVGLGPFSGLVTAALTGVVAFLGGLALEDTGREADRTAVWAFGGLLALAIAGFDLLGSPLAAGDAQLAFELAWLAAAAGIVGVLTEGTRVGIRIRRWRAPVTLAVVVFLATTLVLFAPRNPDGLGLRSALADPTALPALVDAGLVDPLGAYGRVWLDGYGNDYLSHALPLLLTLAVTATVIVVASLLGFVFDRYSGRRELVEFALVWAAVVALVAPVLVVVNAPWHAVGVVVPLSIPAAVAIAAVARRLPSAVREGDVAVGGVGTVVLCVAIVAMLATTAGTAYLHPQSPDNDLVQYGQPADDVREELAAAHGAIAANGDGPDVVYYGAYFHVDNESATRDLPVEDVYVYENDEYDRVGENTAWYHRLPLSWYFDAFGATVDSADTRADLAGLAADEPPVVVTRTEHADNVSAILDGDYERYVFNLTQRNVSTTLFVQRGARETGASATTSLDAGDPEADRLDASVATPKIPGWLPDGSLWSLALSLPLVGAAVGIGRRVGE